jgi:SAM-dependent methyltransferase
VNCRHCSAPLSLTFVDLGFAPPSNAYLTTEQLSAPEMYFPLHIMVCTRCWLAQTRDFALPDELFSSNYAYFSSTSRSWLAHAADYAGKITERLGLNGGSLVIEIASNDGYLLKNFVAAGIPCLGIEPTNSTAEAAENLGIPVIREFFGDALAQGLARNGQQADLIVGNNVYAHVPDINDFTRGIASCLKPGGTVTLEFPHLMRLIEHNQFDTIYHEHFSYLSLGAVSRIFAGAGLRIWDVEELPTHGGSLRIYGCHATSQVEATSRVGDVLRREREAGLEDEQTYRGFQQIVNRVKDDVISFLIASKQSGVRVAAYGAAAKGNTLLNYAGVKPDLLPFVCDAAASKQGKFMPGSHIPILAPEAIERERPEIIMILPWNIESEVRAQLSFVSAWGGRFATAIPKLAIS